MESGTEPRNASCYYILWIHYFPTQHYASYILVVITEEYLCKITCVTTLPDVQIPNRDFLKSEIEIKLFP